MMGEAGRPVACSETLQARYSITVSIDLQSKLCRILCKSQILNLSSQFCLECAVRDEIWACCLKKLSKVHWRIQGKVVDGNASKVC